MKKMLLGIGIMLIGCAIVSLNGGALPETVYPGFAVMAVGFILTLTGFFRKE